MTLPPSNAEPLPPQALHRTTPQAAGRGTAQSVGPETTQPRPYSPSRAPIFVRNATSPNNPTVVTDSEVGGRLPAA